MTRGLNCWTDAGNVSGPIKYGQTGSGENACSFLLAIDRFDQATTWIRVNVYGGLVKVCEQRLQKGVYVAVEGELMNRQCQSTETVEGGSKVLTEVRAKDIVFV